MFIRKLAVLALPLAVATLAAPGSAVAMPKTVCVTNAMNGHDAAARITYPDGPETASDLIPSGQQRCLDVRLRVLSKEYPVINVDFRYNLFKVMPFPWDLCAKVVNKVGLGTAEQLRFRIVENDSRISCVQE
ncbi:hypothetical protein [Azospirillum sp.]|uniref:hypothetical protein n=1 Tax=Azospirillum sp. TaxID=34012 RepID=UPI002D7532A5|nr:hypothetical protein [Azospirillum sp.]HYD69415.1 hypothetical protein [Azospirillum sp.]